MPAWLQRSAWHAKHRLPALNLAPVLAEPRMNKAPIIPFLSAVGAAETANAEWLSALRTAMPGREILPIAQLDEQARAAATYAIVTNPDPAEVARLPNLRWLHSVWAGVDGLLRGMPNPSFKLVRLIDPQLSQTMAESVLSWVLFLHREIPIYQAQQRKNLWLPRPAVNFSARRVGVLGLGALGRVAACRLAELGFDVGGYSRTPRSIPGVRCYHGDAGLQELLSASQIVVCLLPSTQATQGLLDARMLAHLPAGASLINFARAAILDDNALKAALDRAQLAHAVLDVFSREPLPEDSWHWQHPQVTVLPHCAAPTDRNTAAVIVARHIAEFDATGQIPMAVDTTRGY